MLKPDEVHLDHGRPLTGHDFYYTDINTPHATLLEGRRLKLSTLWESVLPKWGEGVQPLTHVSVVG